MDHGMHEDLARALHQERLHVLETEQRRRLSREAPTRDGALSRRRWRSTHR
jgi:hypothetical protein